MPGTRHTPALNMALFFAALGVSLDAAQVNHVQRQLISMPATVLERPEVPLNSVLVVPRQFDAGAHVNATSMLIGDSRGEMTPVAGLAGDFPEVMVGLDEILSPVKEFGNSYGFGRKELLRAAYTGQLLSQKKPRATRRAYEELVDFMAAHGWKALKIKGLLSYEGIPRIIKSKPLQDMVPKDILKFLHNMFEQVNENTEETREADTLVLPKKIRDYLAHTPMDTSGSNDTILSVFLAKNSYCNRVETWARLKKAGGAYKGKNRDIIGAWRVDPETICQQIPEPYTETEPEMDNTRTKTNCIASIGAVEIPDEKALLLAEVPQAA